MDVELLLRVAGRFDRCINELVRLQTERAALLAVLSRFVEVSDGVIDAHWGGGMSAAIEELKQINEKARALVGERDTTDERGAVEGQD